MRTFSSCFMLASAIFIAQAGPAHADGLISQLPDDGAWVRYAVDAKAVGDDGNVRVSMTGTCTISSVGREEVDGKPCRWIEIEMAGKFKRGNREDEVNELDKLLVPEEFLVRGQNPRDHVVKAFKQERSGAVKQLDLKGDGAREVQRFDEIFHSPLPTVEKLGEKDIESKLGTLKCAGEKADDGAGFTTETWLNEKAPFGVVSFAYKKRNRTMSLKLADVGHDAKSKLPNSK